MIIAFYLLAFVAVSFLPLFLWHLWLAPYRILNEKVEDLEAREDTSHAVSSPPAKVDVAKWAGTPIYELGKAACLWVEIEPHSPLSNIDAKAAFDRLSGAIIAGQLHCSTPPLRGVVEFISGQTSSPHYSDKISAVNLKKYAQNIGDVPTFLESIEVPPTEHQPRKAEHDE